MTTKVNVIRGVKGGYVVLIDSEVDPFIEQETLIYDRKLSKREREKVIKHLKAKYPK